MAIDSSKADRRRQAAYDQILEMQLRLVNSSRTAVAESIAPLKLSSPQLYDNFVIFKPETKNPERN